MEIVVIDIIPWRIVTLRWLSWMWWQMLLLRLLELLIHGMLIKDELLLLLKLRMLLMLLFRGNAEMLWQLLWQLRMLLCCKC